MRLVLRFRKARTRLGGFVTASLGIHVVLVGLVLALPNLRSAARPIEPSMVVELAGAIAPPSRTPPAQTPTARPPEPAKPPEPQGDHAVREIKPAPKKPKEKEAPKKPEPPDEPRTAEQGPTPSGPKPPGPAGAQPGPGVRGVTAEEVGDPGLAWYNASVTAALDAAWIRPVLEDARQMLSVVVAFEIDRSGGVRGVEIARSSGVPSVDRSALRAVTDAAPFPRPPAGHDLVRQRIRFDLMPDAP